jgi:serine/threonine-protein kinase
MTRPAPPLRSAAPGVSLLVADVVDRALAFNKAMRWSDARRMQEAVRRAYHERTGVSIATAPPLTVPESVENRTLPAYDPSSRGLPTTVRPVAGTANRFFADKRRSLWAVAAAGGVVAVTFVAVALSGGERAQPSAKEPSSAAAVPAATAAVVPAASTAVAAPPAAPSATVEPPSDTHAAERSLSPLPEVAATDLPSAVPPPSQSPPVGAAKAPSAATKANCNPPYVLNPATGKKNWKVECL